MIDERPEPECADIDCRHFKINHDHLGCRVVDCRCRRPYGKSPS